MSRRTRSGAVLAAACAFAAVLVVATTVLAQQNQVGVELNATANVEFSGPVATFDEGIPEPPSAFSAAIDWGDGGTPSAGTVAQTDCGPGLPDRTCFEVRGTHTYAAAGTYTVLTQITGPSGRVRALGTATVSEPEAASAAIAGPTRITLGQPTRFTAETNPPADSFRWDLDGDGSYETDTGTAPFVDHPFANGGAINVGLLAGFADGSEARAALNVVVERPSLLALATKPAYPIAGKRFKLRLHHVREASTRFELLSWRIKGVRPTRKQSTLRLKRPAQSANARAAGVKTPPTTVYTKGEFATTGLKLPLKIADPGYYPVEITVHDNKGVVQELNAGFSVAKGKPKLSFDKFIDCDKASLGPGGQEQISFGQTSLHQFCAQFAVLGTAAAGVEVGFENSSPNAELCGAKVTPFTSVNPFDYPSPETFFGPLAGQRPFPRAGSGGSASRPSRRGICVLQAHSKVVEWNFGDGASITSPQGAIPDLVHHAYKAPGTYNVKLVADVPYAVKEGENGDSPDEWRYVRSERTHAVHVAKPFCGSVTVRGILVVPVADVQGEVQAGSAGCFIAAGPGLSSKFTSFPGHRLELGGLPLRNSSGLVVEPAKSTIVPKVPGQTLSVGFPQRPGLTGPQVGATKNQVAEMTKLTVPVLQTDPLLGAKAARVATGGGFVVGGLPATQVEAFAAPAGGPFLKASVDLPPPLGPGTPPAVVNAAAAGAKRAETRTKGRVAAKSHLGVPTDFSLDVGGQSLGPFALPGSFLLEHKVAGGWIGGGKIGVPGLGTVEAPYKPPPAQASSAECAQITGPSGISLNASGQFEFGGAALTNANIPLGPVATLNCVAVKGQAGQATPFVLEGRAAGTVPPPGPFWVNSCFFFSVLQGGQTLSPGCAVAPWKAPAKTVWLRAQGSVRLFNSIDLGDGAFVDVKAGGTTQIEAGGAVKLTAIDNFLLTIRFGASVNGKVIVDPFRYHLIGKAFICVENIGPNIGCHNIGQGGVSSKGMGFCTSIASVVKYWNDGVDWWWGNCNLEKKIGVSRLMARAAGGGMRLRGGGLKVPRGLDQVGFAITGAPRGGSPVVTVEGPGKRPTRVVDNGEPFQQTRGYDVIHGVDETLVVVRNPKAGKWSVEPQPGSPPLTSAGLRMPIAEPRVNAGVSSDGERRVLSYKARLAPGDRLVFIEEGRAVTRRLGPSQVREGNGKIEIHRTPSVGGQRTILAVVERRGVPYKVFKVAKYQAPKPVALPPPDDVKLTAARGGLKANWPEVGGAKTYEVKVRLSDGRILRELTKKSGIEFPGISDQVGAKISVAAVADDLRTSKPVGDGLRARRGPPIVLHPE